MKTLQLFSVFCLLFFNCSGQDKTQKTEENIIKPDENITVNKEYDEFGNLKRYDSIYSYSYSSNGKMSDSLKLQFEKNFNKHSLFKDSFFDDFFGKDSLMGSGFYPDNFFQKGFMNHDSQIKSMMKRMDSIQQLFFNRNRGMIIPPEPEKKSKVKDMKQI